MEELNFALGVQEFAVNGGRSVRFNPADEGFLEALYGLLAKLGELTDERTKKTEKAGENWAKRFELAKACDDRMRKEMDSVFGEGFCADVFGSVRLTAAADGLSVAENFIWSVVDRMDEGIKANLARRSERIRFYTDKYKHRRAPTDAVAGEAGA